MRLAAAIMNIVVTSAAESFMRRMVNFVSGAQIAGFRLMVQEGGCAGFASQFSIEAAPKAGDVTLEVNGLKIFLPQETRTLLEGATIDFRDSPTSTGLSIVNPNAGNCGCGNTGAGRGGRHAAISVADIRRNR